MSKFEPGKSGNKAGRPKGSGGKQSKLRKLQRLLEEMTPSALEKIEAIMLGAPKAETQLAAAKFIIDSFVTVRDKVAIDEAKLNEEASKPEEPEAPSGPRLSLVQQ